MNSCHFHDEIEFYLAKGRAERSKAFHDAFSLAISQVRKIFVNETADAPHLHSNSY